jgi:hypothetical protein
MMDVLDRIDNLEDFCLGIMGLLPPPDKETATDSVIEAANKVTIGIINIVQHRLEEHARENQS